MQEQPGTRPALNRHRGWSWQAVGPRPGRPVRKVQVLGGREVPLPPRCAGYEGYNLHAGVGVEASDRGGLERLARSKGG